ncbi:prepilin peptidase [Staphylococcus felis]|uniref:prepilin peptidase n=2 Tax=Staphylococcus felis TaxID=46127 RepID=UPI00115A5E72
MMLKEVVMVGIIFFTGASLMSFLLQISEVKCISIQHMMRRSCCSSCSRRLNFAFLIPIFSYAILKGKCRYCKAIIPIYLWIGEIFGGILFIIPIYLEVDIHLSIFYLVTLILLTLSIIDLRFLIVPHRWLVILVICAFFMNHIPKIELNQWLLFILLLCIGLISPHLIGFGDIKLLMLFSLIFPFKFMILFLFLIFPIALLLLPFFLALKWIKIPFIPLVPSIFVSFLLVSLFFQDLVYYFGGVI